MDELLVEFLNETQESLGKLDANLVALEKDPEDEQNINEIFRMFHTIKGTSGFLELYRLGTLAHVAENLLSSYRAKEKKIETSGISVILKTVDRLIAHLDGIAKTGKELEGDDDDIIKLLEEELKNKKGVSPEEISKPAKKPKRQKKVTPEKVIQAEQVEDEVMGGEELETFIHNLFDENVSLSTSNETKDTSLSSEEQADDNSKSVEEMAGELGKMILDKSNSEDSSKATENNVVEGFEEEFSPLKLFDLKKDSLSVAVQPKKEVDAPQLPREAKVRLDLLEKLMDGVSELVLTRNQILQIQKTSKDKSLDVSIKRLNYVTSELQEGIMQTRMQPIGTLWARLPRIVRDLSIELKKSIECSMYGEDTEIDRQVLEYMRDPIVHLVRNACDHGIESTEERIAAGKNESGVISVKAYQEGGYIYIEVGDDGKGIDLDKIIKKMVESGKLTQQEASNVPEHILYNSLFEAGFTTSENITAVSGRGVGLDVVRTNINKIGGTVEIKSIKGEGSSFTVKIPLSLAIVNTLMINCYGQDFALPQLAVLKVGKITNDENMRVKYLNKHPVLQSRGVMYPLVLLEKLLKLTKPNKIEDKSSSTDNTDLSNSDSRKSHDSWSDRYVLIVQGGSINFGLVVDNIHDTEEIVVKPLSRLLSSLNMFSGNTILGDGKVIMILDPNGLSQSVQNISRLTQKATADESDLIAIGNKNNQFSYLTFEDWKYPQRLGVSLLQVNRIEELNTFNIEYPSGKASVVYNNKFMPIVTISEEEIPQGKKIPALILLLKGRHIALLIKTIINLVETNSQLDISTSKNNIAGSVLIDNKALDVVDIDYYFEKYLNIDKLVSDNNEMPKETVLIIESNPTRYAKYQRFLSQKNINNNIHTKASTAIQVFNHKNNSSAIYKKIFYSENMQDMSAEEFMQRLRQTQYGRKAEVFVICDKITKENEGKYLEAGFKYCLSLDDFQIKLDQIYSPQVRLIS